MRERVKFSLKRIMWRARSKTATLFPEEGRFGRKNASGGREGSERVFEMQSSAGRMAISQ